MIRGNVDATCGVLAERAHVENEAVAVPGFLADVDQSGIVRARRREAGFDAAHRLLATEVMGNRDDDRLGQLNLQSCEGSYRTPRGPRQLRKRKDFPGRSRYPPGLRRATLPARPVQARGPISTEALLRS